MFPNTGKIKLIIKPNSKKNEIIGLDKEKGAYRINIKAKAESNKANTELIKNPGMY